MNAEIAASSIVNLCGIVGLSAALLMVGQRDRRGPLTRRVAAALGLVILLFALRGVAWAAPGPLFMRLALPLRR